MRQLKVVIAEDDPIARRDIKEMLAEENIITIGECEDGATAINLVQNLKPDLILMDIKMPKMSGLEAAKALNKDGVAPVMLLTAFSQKEFIEEARKSGVLAYLVKPINKQNLIPACHIAITRYEEFNVLVNEVKDLNNAIETRKTIEKAKGLLQKKYNIDEEAAFKKIRSISMNQRKTMREVAEAMILTFSE